MMRERQNPGTTNNKYALGIQVIIGRHSYSSDLEEVLEEAVYHTQKLVEFVDREIQMTFAEEILILPTSRPRLNRLSRR